jgi:hypothetical protein
MCYKIVIFSVLQKPNSGTGRLVFEASRSHTVKRTSPVGLLWTSGQLVANAAAYTTYKKFTRRTSIPSAGFETTIQAVKRLQTYALNHMVSGIGSVI